MCIGRGRPSGFLLGRQTSKQVPIRTNYNDLNLTRFSRQNNGEGPSLCFSAIPIVQNLHFELPVCRNEIFDSSCCFLEIDLHMNRNDSSTLQNVWRYNYSDCWLQRWRNYEYVIETDLIIIFAMTWHSLHDKFTALSCKECIHLRRLFRATNYIFFEDMDQKDIFHLPNRHIIYMFLVLMR